jgi:hypothetical protein
MFKTLNSMVSRLFCLNCYYKNIFVTICASIQEIPTSLETPHYLPQIIPTKRKERKKGGGRERERKKRRETILINF